MQMAYKTLMAVDMSNAHWLIILKISQIPSILKKTIPLSDVDFVLLDGRWEFQQLDWICVSVFHAVQNKWHVLHIGLKDFCLHGLWLMVFPVQLLLLLASAGR